MSKSSQYLHQLTWLRGFAAFLVLIAHTIRATEVAYSDNDQVATFALAAAFDMGNFGVILFFTLSGATLFISCNGVLSSPYAFYVKRFFRIWPAFMVSLIAYMVFALVFKQYYTEQQGHWIEGQFLGEYDLYDVLAYATFTSNWYGTEGLFNNAYWSLPVEFQFYLIFPLILLSLSRFGQAGPIVIGISLLIIQLLLPIPELSSAFFRLGYSFCGGVLLGHFYTTQTLRIPARSGLMILVVAYTIVTLLTKNIIPMPTLTFVRQIYNWHVLFAFIFMTVCMFSNFTLPGKLSVCLEHFGKISYSTYLYHNLVIGMMVLLLINMNITNGLLRYLLVVSGTVGITYIVAVYSYKWIEIPSIALARKLIENTPENQLDVSQKPVDRLTVERRLKATLDKHSSTLVEQQKEPKKETDESVS